MTTPRERDDGPMEREKNVSRPTKKEKTDRDLLDKAISQTQERIREALRSDRRMKVTSDRETD